MGCGTCGVSPDRFPLTMIPIVPGSFITRWVEKDGVTDCSQGSKLRTSARITSRS